METRYSLKILILGGTEFMGKALLDELDPYNDSVLICCVNRGKLHWYFFENTGITRLESSIPM